MNPAAIGAVGNSAALERLKPAVASTDPPGNSGLALLRDFPEVVTRIVEIIMADVARSVPVTGPGS